MDTLKKNEPAVQRAIAETDFNTLSILHGKKLSNLQLEKALDTFRSKSSEFDEFKKKYHMTYRKVLLNVLIFWAISFILFATTLEGELQRFIKTMQHFSVIFNLFASFHLAVILAVVKMDISLVRLWQKAPSTKASIEMVASFAQDQSAVFCENFHIPDNGEKGQWISHADILEMLEKRNEKFNMTAKNFKLMAKALGTKIKKSNAGLVYFLRPKGGAERAVKAIRVCPEIKTQAQ